MNDAIEHVVMYSGGICSFFTALLVCEEVGPDNVTLLFTDTRMEHASLYKFLHEGAEILGCRLVMPADGRDPFQVFADVKLMGNTRVDPCSRILKRNLAKAWVQQNASEDSTIYLGYDFSESHRLERSRAMWVPYQVEAPLVNRSELNRSTMIQILGMVGIDLPYLYKIGMAHNNCSGFCVKAGQGHYINLLNKDPELYRQFEEREDATYKAIGKQHPFLRVTKDNKTHYVTLKQFRAMISAGGKVDKFDIGGCGCFTPEDES